MKTESSSILLSPDVPFPSANPLASRVFSASEPVRRIHRDWSQRFSCCAERSHRSVCARPRLSAAARWPMVCDGIQAACIVAAPKLGSEISANAKIALLALLIVWTFAAFGEEIAYRGYLLTRAADIGRRSTTAYWLGIVFVSILFGYGHYYKGPSGIVDSGIAGLILGAAYMLAGRNLWACILAHGFIDTFAVIDAFFRWSK